MAHKLLLNGKGNKLHVPRRYKMPRQTVTESKLTSPFMMEDLLHGVKALKNNKAAGLDDMLCEQIKHFGEATLRWLLQMMNSIMKTQKFPKLWRKSKVIAPNDTAYKWWSCHSRQELLCKLCRTLPPPAMGARFTVFGHAGHADPLDGWRCCSQKRVMSRPIQVRQH